MSNRGRLSRFRLSLARVPATTRSLPRVIHLPEEVAGCEYGFVFLSSILHAHVNELFAGMRVLGCYQFRVTRNSELFVDDEEVEDLLQAVEGELRSRRYGDRGARARDERSLYLHASDVLEARHRRGKHRGSGLLNEKLGGLAIRRRHQQRDARRTRQRGQ